MGPLAIEKIILLFKSSWNIGNIHFLPLSFSWTSVSHCCPKRIKMWNQKLNYWIIFEVLILDLPVGNFAGKSSLCIWRSIFLKGCQQNVNLYWYSCPILNGEYFNRGIFALHFSVKRAICSQSILECLSHIQLESNRQITRGKHNLLFINKKSWSLEQELQCTSYLSIILRKIIIETLAKPERQHFYCFASYMCIYIILYLFLGNFPHLYKIFIRKTCLRA